MVYDSAIASFADKKGADPTASNLNLSDMSSVIQVAADGDLVLRTDLQSARVACALAALVAAFRRRSQRGAPVRVEAAYVAYDIGKTYVSVPCAEMLVQLRDLLSRALIAAPLEVFDTHTDTRVAAASVLMRAGSRLVTAAGSTQQVSTTIVVIAAAAAACLTHVIPGRGSERDVFFAAEAEALGRPV